MSNAKCIYLSQSFHQLRWMSVLTFNPVIPSGLVFPDNWIGPLGIPRVSRLVYHMFHFNPIALRTAKTSGVLAVLSAIGLNTAFRGV